MTRIYDAPRALVWAAVTDRNHVKEWWGGPGTTNPVCEMDVRPGGAWKHVMRFPNGMEIVMNFVFVEKVARPTASSRLATRGPWPTHEWTTHLRHHHHARRGWPEDTLHDAGSLELAGGARSRPGDGLHPPHRSEPRAPRRLPPDDGALLSHGLRAARPRPSRSSGRIGSTSNESASRKTRTFAARYCRLGNTA